MTGTKPKRGPLGLFTLDFPGVAPEVGTKYCAGAETDNDSRPDMWESLSGSYDAPPDFIGASSENKQMERRMAKIERDIGYIRQTLEDMAEIDEDYRHRIEEAFGRIEETERRIDRKAAALLTTSTQPVDYSKALRKLAESLGVDLGA